MTILTRLYEASVFKPVTTRRLHSQQVLVLMFHRTAAFTYALVALWGVTSAITGVQTLAVVWGAGIQSFYSLCVALAALVGMVGAAFFPRTARMEMYATSSLLPLTLLYTALLGFHVFFLGDLDRASLLPFSMLPVPIILARIIFVYTSLIEQASQEQG